MTEPAQQVTGILGIFTAYPDLAAAAVGLSLSWCATQFVKKQLPDEWPTPKYRRAIQVVGFFCGWGFTLGAWMLFDPTASHFEKFYYPAGIGFASPALYALIVPYLSTKWPRIGKALSGRPDDDT
jgi:hypothetical protein